MDGYLQNERKPSFFLQKSSGTYINHRMYYWVFQTINLLLYPIQLHSCAIITMTTIQHQSDSQSKRSVSHSGIV